MFGEPDSGACYHAQWERYAEFEESDEEESALDEYDLIELGWIDADRRLPPRALGVVRRAARAGHGEILDEAQSGQGQFGNREYEGHEAQRRIGHQLFTPTNKKYD